MCKELVCGNCNKVRCPKCGKMEVNGAPGCIAEMEALEKEAEKCREKAREKAVQAFWCRYPWLLLVCTCILPIPVAAWLVYPLMSWINPTLVQHNINRAFDSAVAMFVFFAILMVLGKESNLKSRNRVAELAEQRFWDEHPSEKLELDKYQEWRKEWYKSQQ